VADFMHPVAAFTAGVVMPVAVAFMAAAAVAVTPEAAAATTVTDKPANAAQKRAGVSPGPFVVILGRISP
jgi:hypothetical protein